MASLAVVGVTASFAQVLVNAIGASRAVADFYEAIVDAPQEILWLKTRVQNIRLRLECLQYTKIAYDEQGHLPPQLVVLLKESMGIMWQALMRVQRQLPVDFHGKPKKLLSWVLKNRMVMTKLELQLRDAEQSLTQILQVVQAHMADLHQRSLDVILDKLPGPSHAARQHLVAQFPRIQTHFHTMPPSSKSSPEHDLVTAASTNIVHTATRIGDGSWWLRALGLYVSVRSTTIKADVMSSTWMLYRFPLVGKGIQLCLHTKRSEVLWTDWTFLGGFVRLKNIVPQSSKFMEACYHGNLEQVRSHLANRTGSVSDMTETGNTALAQAVRSGNVDVVQCMLDAGADANAVDNNQRCMLQFSLRSAYTTISRLLIRAQASVHHVNVLGTTLCMISATGKLCIESFELLAAADADFSAADAEGFTALHFAATNGSSMDIDTIFKLGAHPASKNKDGHNPLHEAAAAGNLDAVQSLLHHHPNLASQSDHYGWTALHWAVRQGVKPLPKYHSMAAIVPLLLEKGADENITAEYQAGWTPRELREVRFTPAELALALGMRETRIYVDSVRAVRVCAA